MQNWACHAMSCHVILKVAINTTPICFILFWIKSLIYLDRYNFIINQDLRPSNQLGRLYSPWLKKNKIDRYFLEWVKTTTWLTYKPCCHSYFNILNFFNAKAELKFEGLATFCQLLSSKDNISILNGKTLTPVHPNQPSM